MKQEFEIIATREIDIVSEDGKPVGQALVHIGRPWQEPTGEWAAPFQILGLGRARVSRAFGLDAIQALQLVHRMIGGMLEASDQGRQGRLRWAGSSDLGFPVYALRPEDR